MWKRSYQTSYLIETSMIVDTSPMLNLFLLWYVVSLFDIYSSHLAQTLITDMI